MVVTVVKIVTRLTTQGCNNIVISWLYWTCWNNLATSLIILTRLLTACYKQWVVPEKIHTPPTEEISAVRRGRGEKIVSDNSICIRTSEGGRGVNFQFSLWGWYGCFVEWPNLGQAVRTQLLTACWQTCYKMWDFCMCAGTIWNMLYFKYYTLT
jgi:hypothetical protein